MCVKVKILNKVFGGLGYIWEGGMGWGRGFGYLDFSGMGERVMV